MEHHSNIVPWQIVCQQIGAVLRVIPINDAGELDLAAYQQLLNKRTKLVAIVHMSNSLGTINPVQEIIQLAHANNTPVLLDGAQAVVHQAVDVQQLNCDFYTFSSHKLFGPTGVGVLYGKAKLLESMPPYQGGGDMISQVSFSKTLYREIPHKFEAGTPHISGVIGLGAAIDYVKQLDAAAAQKYETELLHYGTQQLMQIPKLRLIGTAQYKAAILSFVLDDIHAHDVGTILDHEGIAVRTGHHCTMPLMERFNVPATVRASLTFYNTKEEIDILVKGLHKVRELFK
jgi:cysteine desulfurase / selenocysteine lyase